VVVGVTGAGVVAGVPNEKRRWPLGASEAEGAACVPKEKPEGRAVPKEKPLLEVGGGTVEPSLTRG
jgi:hypothetical protein